MTHLNHEELFTHRNSLCDEKAPCHTPNQERCCEKCVEVEDMSGDGIGGAREYCKNPSCPCHTQNKCKCGLELYLGESHCGACDYDGHTQNHKVEVEQTYSSSNEIIGVKANGVELMNNPQNHSTKEEPFVIGSAMNGGPMIVTAYYPDGTKKDITPHSTMEGWIERFQFFFCEKNEDGRYSINKTAATAEVITFFSELLAKERESAERRGREKAVEYIKANAERMTLVRTSDFDAVLLEAAHKDTDEEPFVDPNPVTVRRERFKLTKLEDTDV